jgi:hypothetical protein
MGIFILTMWIEVRGSCSRTGLHERPSLAAVIADTKKPLLLGTKEESEKLETFRVRRGKGGQGESYLGVPILAGQKAIALIAVQSYKQDATGRMICACAGPGRR